MNISEKIAYIKGLAEGLSLDDSSKEGKVLLAIIDALEEVGKNMNYIEFELDVIGDQINDIEGDIAEIFEEDCDCECDCEDLEDEDEYEEIYEVVCPKCQESVLLDEDMIDEGEVVCYKCGEKLEIDFSDTSELN